MSNPASAEPPREVLWGLFLTALSTLAYEILLTRIYSVTLWYHFAFMAISVAMFGLAAGALAVHRFPAYFNREPLPRLLSRFAALYAVACIGSLVCILQIRVVGDGWPMGIALALIYTLSAVPFFLGGVTICLVLTRYPQSVGRLYAADLSGAALGCLAIWFLLPHLGGPGAVLAAALIGASGAWSFARAGGESTRAPLVLIGLIGAPLLYSTVQGPLPLFHLKWVKGEAEQGLVHEEWNSFSRISLKQIMDGIPRGWGLSEVYRPQQRVEQILLQVDAAAGTVLTRYRGQARELEHLRYDVTSVAHYLRADAGVAVLGVGGGRDILAALAFEQPRILGIELNDAILRTVNQRYGEFTGHLDRLPQVEFVHDEARSYLARQPERFDLIQLSLIDTWAATAAGAYALSENSLYTLEAWAQFVDHLRPGGILSVSRYYSPESPHELYRLAALAAASLRASGVMTPERHLVIVARREEPSLPGVATLLLCQAPFTEGELGTLEGVSRQLAFEVLFRPGASHDDRLGLLLTGRGIEDPQVRSRFRLNVEPPTDDTPYFFNMLRLRDALGGGPPAGGMNQVNLRAVSVLGFLLAISGVLTLLCVVGPLCWSGGEVRLRRHLHLFLYFAAIGGGFMLVEVSQLQRLIVFLGHPTYGLCVVLFAFLLAGSLGSLFASGAHAPLRVRRARLLVLLGVVILFGLITPSITTALRGAETPVRLLTAVGILLPLGAALGMAFPLGMEQTLREAPTLGPWMWGINGATSVGATVLGLALSMEIGITNSYWLGAVSYGLAVLALWRPRGPGDSA